jgi:type IV fimbrial biogenesis protein FimT
VLKGHFHRRGFTLVELLVGIALLAVILRLAIPSVQTLVQNTQIRGAAESIQNGLQFARTEALRRNRTVKFEMGTGSAWTVGCDPSDATTDAAGNELCPATMQSRSAQEGSSNAVVATAQLNAATNAVSGSPVFAGAVTFNGLGRTVAATLPAGNNARFAITNPTGGTCVSAGGEMRCLNVIVTSGGTVRMCDPAVASTDPRAC